MRRFANALLTATLLPSVLLTGPLLPGILLTACGSEDKDPAAPACTGEACTDGSAVDSASAPDATASDATASDATAPDTKVNDAANPADDAVAAKDSAAPDGSPQTDAGPAPCNSDADCAAAEDGDLCNGTLVCDKGANPPACVVDPKTVITCPASEKTCHANVCDSKTGKCSEQQAEDGAMCKGKWPVCWTNTTCKAGVCQGGVPLCKCHPDWEADADPATPKCNTWAVQDDQCLGKLGCVPFVGGAEGAYTCDVVADSVVKCDSSKDDDCNVNTCDPGTGTCAAKALNGNLCDDGDACTNGEQCDAGVCKIPGYNGGTFICKCAPDYLDLCNNELGGFPCDGTIYCDTSGAVPKCAFKDPVVCDGSGDTVCAQNKCDEKSGKCAVTPAKEGTLCDDGDACTANDECKAGKCTAGAVNLCK